MVAVVAAAAPLVAQERDEPERVSVFAVRFEGNRALDDAALRAAIATSESSWWAKNFGWLGLGEKRYFDETEFRRDVLRLQALYGQSGFVDAIVDTLVRRTPVGVGIRFRIHEGEPIRVTALEITGVEAEGRPERLVRELPLRVGDPFNRLRLLASADTIVTHFRDRGYPFVQVFRNFDVNREERTAQVTFDVDLGPRARVRAVEVIGADEIPELVVQRLIPVRPGRIYRERDLYESQLDLYRMGVYNFVNVSLADSVGDGPGDSLVTVHVQVAEGPLRRVRLGAGYGSLDCFRTLSTWTGRGVLGGARQLQLSGRLSKIGTGDPFSLGFQDSVCWELSAEDSTRRRLNFNLNASLHEPLFFSRRTRATVSLFAERESEFNAFLRTAWGGEISFTRQLRSNLPVTLSYSLARVRTQADPATLCAFFDVCLQTDTVFSAPRRRSTVALLLVRNTTNSLLEPSRGTLLTGEVRWGASVIGADRLSRFAKAVLELGVYQRVSRSGVFAWRVRLGGVVAPPAPRDLGGERQRFVPPEERFFLGGATSVRGFAQNALGPVVRVIDTLSVRDTVAFINEATGARDTLAGRLRTSAVGGNHVALVNAELRVPLSGRLSAAVFVDAGRVIEGGDQFFDLATFRVTPGFGVRLGSPLGPIRLDIAYNASDPPAGDLFLVDRASNELKLLQRGFTPSPPDFLGRLQVHFSVGQAF